MMYDLGWTVAAIIGFMYIKFTFQRASSYRLFQKSSLLDSYKFDCADYRQPAPA